jgi:uncharacterized Zn-finger protein
MPVGSSTLFRSPASAPRGQRYNAGEAEVSMSDDETLMIDDREVVLTTRLHVSCDGGGGALGHPVEYLTLERGGETVCKYCGRRFVHRDAPGAASLRAASAASTG